MKLTFSSAITLQMAAMLIVSRPGRTCLQPALMLTKGSPHAFA